MNYKILIFFFISISLCACSTGVKRNELLYLHAQALEDYNNERYSSAEKLYKIIVKRSPNEADPWFRLGNIYAHTHRPEEAIKAYREAVIRQPQLSKAWHNMGIVHLRQTGNAFNQLIIQLDAKDPLYERAMKLNETVIELLNQQEQSAPDQQKYQ